MSKHRLKPPPLKKGGCIGVCSPAWFVESHKLHAAKILWEDLGYRVYLHPQTTDRDAALAGSPVARADALHELLLDPNVDAVMFSDGGYGCIQLLEHLNFDLIRQHPKILMGFSDVSLLLLAIQAKTGLITFHGPTFCDLLTDFSSPFSFQSLTEVLAGGCPTYTLNSAECPTRVIVPGTTHGSLFGGNFVRMNDLIGTPFLPEMKDCLFFTESNMPTYPTLDGSLYHLRLSQALETPRAILLGSMELVHTDNPKPKYQTLKYNLTVDSLLPYHFPDIPIVADMPFSHVRPDFATFPVGVEFELNARAKGPIVLEQSESAVA